MSAAVRPRLGTITLTLHMPPNSDADESLQIQERYRRRTTVYDPFDPWVYLTRQELERSIIRQIKRASLDATTQLRVLDIGCGSGGHLLGFLRLGFLPENLVGCELQGERIKTARSVLPAAVRLIHSAAQDADVEAASFDIVFQSLVFSSILSDEVRASVAASMWRAARPGGGVLWYDFTVDNPKNPDVRGVPLDEVRRLFPAAPVVARKVTLAPPLSRRATRIHPVLYGVLNLLPVLRTHVLAWAPKS